MPIPRLVPASEINIFKFYEDGRVHEVIMHDGVIMKLAKAFLIEQSKEAYQFAHSLSQNYSTVLSPASDIYRVWVDIRCLDDFGFSFSLPDKNS